MPCGGVRAARDRVARAAQLPRPADPYHRSVFGGRWQRCARAHSRAEAAGALRPAGGGGEQARRWRQYRGRVRGAERGGRLHTDCCQQRFYDDAVDPEEHPVQPGQFCAGEHHCRTADGVRGQQRASGENHRRIHRLRKGKSRKTFLRHRGLGDAAPSRDGTVPDHDRHENGDGPLQGRAGDDARPDAGPDQRAVQRARFYACQLPGRQDPPARGRRTRAAVAPAGGSDGERNRARRGSADLARIRCAAEYPCGDHPPAVG